MVEINFHAAKEPLMVLSGSTNRLLRAGQPIPEPLQFPWELWFSHRYNHALGICKSTNHSTAFHFRAQTWKHRAEPALLPLL